MDAQQDLRISFRRRLDGTPYAVVRIRTTEDIIWHTVSLPQGSDVFAMHHQIVTEALQRLNRLGLGRITTMQEVLPIGGGHE
jgi:hypothetical protein